MSIRSITAGCLLSIAVCSPVCHCAPTDPDPRPAHSFRSELWRMEFQKPEQQDANALPNELPESLDNGGRKAIVVRGPDVDQQLVHQGQLVPSGVPGQTQLKELQAETPFAEWHVDEVADGTPPSRIQAQASAWTMSQTFSSRSGVSRLPMTDGPSVLTFLVAVVAGIVMIGAFFSGRE